MGMSIEKAIDVLNGMKCSDGSEEYYALQCAVACMKEIKIRDSMQEKRKRIWEQFEDRIAVVYKDYGFTEADRPLLESFQKDVINPVIERIKYNITVNKNAEEMKHYRALGSVEQLRERMELLELYQRVYGKEIEAG